MSTKYINLFVGHKAQILIIVNPSLIIFNTLIFFGVFVALDYYVNFFLDVFFLLFCKVLEPNKKKVLT